VVDVYGIQLKHLYQGKIISLDEAWRIHNERQKAHLAATNLFLCSDEELLKELKLRIEADSVKITDKD